MKFKLARMLGKLPDGEPAYPPLSAGVIWQESAAAGSYFPQKILMDVRRFDDALGNEYQLITKHRLKTAQLTPFAESLSKWFEQQKAEAVLVRPDRYECLR